MHRVIRVLSGPLEGDEFLLEDRLEIGRSGDLAIQLIGPSVSRRHAQVRIEPDGKVVLTDLHSRNGTYVHGERIQTRVLASGDTFEIGKSCFCLEERSGSPTADSDPKLNLLSGPALDITETIERQPLLARALRTTTAPEAREAGGCQDPLHTLARQKQWRFCPVCGEHPHDRDTGEHEIPPRE